MKRLSAILFVLSCVLSYVAAQDSPPAIWFPLWVRQDKLVTMMDNPAQKAQMIAWGRELWPESETWRDLYDAEGNVTGRVDVTDQVIEAYLTEQRDFPNLWLDGSGVEWNLLLSNWSLNMLGKKNVGKVNDTAWLAAIRAKMKSLNPIKGGYYTPNIQAMAASEGLTQIQGEEPQ